MDTAMYGFNNTIITLLMLFSSIGILVLGSYVYVNSQRTRVFIWFEVWMGLLLSWNWSYMMRQVAPDLQAAWVLFSIEVISVAFLGPVILCFARAYRGWDNRRSLVVRLAFLCAIFLSLFVATNPLHYKYIVALTGELEFYGNAYYISGMFVFICFIGSAYFFLRGFRNPSIYWKNQLSYIGGSVVVLVLAGIIQSLRIFDLSLNLPLLMLPFSLILTAIAVMKYQFLDILPFSLLEAMNFVDDGFMVFGIDGDLEDFNHIFFDKFFQINQCQTIEDVLIAMSSAIDDSVSLSNLAHSLSVKKDSFVSGELMIKSSEGNMHLQYTTKAICDGTGVKIASIITYHDMTELHELYETLEDKKEQLLAARERLESHIDTVQQLTIETERNALMTEVHDTLGHSMAEVLALLEQCEMILLDDTLDATKSVQVIEEALKQSRKSLTEIRTAVGRFRKMGVEER